MEGTGRAHSRPARAGQAFARRTAFLRIGCRACDCKEQRETKLGTISKQGRLGNEAEMHKRGPRTRRPTRERTRASCWPQRRATDAGRNWRTCSFSVGSVHLERDDGVIETMGLPSLPRPAGMGAGPLLGGGDGGKGVSVLPFAPFRSTSSISPKKSSCLHGGRPSSSPLGAGCVRVAALLTRVQRTQRAQRKRGGPLASACCRSRGVRPAKPELGGRPQKKERSSRSYSSSRRGARLDNRSLPEEWLLRRGS